MFVFNTPQQQQYQCPPPPPRTVCVVLLHNSQLLHSPCGKQGFTPSLPLVPASEFYRSKVSVLLLNAHSVSTFARFRELTLLVLCEYHTPAFGKRSMYQCVLRNEYPLLSVSLELGIP